MRSSLARSLVLLVVVIATAMCQPVPQPFAPEVGKRTKSDLLDLSDRSGIVVLNTDGLSDDESDRLANAMSTALLNQNIPATTTGGNSRSHFLQGHAEITKIGRRRVQVALDWELFDAKGELVGKHRVVATAPTKRWNDGDPVVIERLAKRSARGVAKYLQNSSQTISAATRSKIYVSSVAGAPGNGPLALRDAMIVALLRAKMNVTRGRQDSTLVVAGNVNLSQPEDGRQNVEIVWTVTRRDGKELGNLKQANTIAEGSLDRDWGPVAGFVAQDAVSGIVAMLSRLPEDVVVGERRDVYTTRGR